MTHKTVIALSLSSAIFILSLAGLATANSRDQSDFETAFGSARMSSATSSQLTVTKNADTNDGACDADCSLREAIDVAASGAEIVVPSGTYTLTFGSQLSIGESLKLQGAGTSTTIIQAATQPGTASFPVFGISNGDVTISGVSIRHGNATGNGGGVSNSANLTLHGVRLTENRATASGGAVANFKSLIVTNSSFSNNHAGIQGGALYSDGFANLSGVTLSANTTDNAGGGIRNALNSAVTLNKVNISGNSASIVGGGIFNTGTVHLTDSAVAGNSSVDGGGLYNTGSMTLINSAVNGNLATSAGGGITTSKPDDNVGVLLLLNSTVSGNTTNGPGGGIVSSGGTLSLTNSTVAANSSGLRGGGIWADTGTLGNTIVADNLAPSSADCFANHQPFISLGHNLVGDLGGCNYTQGAGDITGSPDAKLGPLQDNGGPTLTHALKSGSPAIDAGDDSTAPNTDQRGVARPQGSASDIGAFERIPEQPPRTDFTPNSTTTGDAPLNVQFTDTSAGYPTSWLWNFGDGSTSRLRNPSHTYNRGGVFTVILTSTNSFGRDTETKVGLIRVTGLMSKIAFTSNRDGNSEIYLMDADGSNLVRLTNDPEEDYDPAWSPDGKLIAFQARRDDGQGEIYVMNQDGTEQTRLTNKATREEAPSWSPDGTRIAYASNDIYVMNADGTNTLNVTGTSESERLPSWSPSGEKIAFTKRLAGNWEIFVMDPDGSNQVNLTDNDAPDSGSAWSPDGMKVIFASGGISVMNADGSSPMLLTAGSSESPTWSPDGTRIAFMSARQSNSWEIYVMNSDGSASKNITNHPAFDAYPAYSPEVFPQVPTDLQTTTPESNNTPTFKWHATPSTLSYEMRFDGGAWTTIGNTTTFTASSSMTVGDHIFEVRSIAVTGFEGSPARLAFAVSSPMCRYDFNDSNTTERVEAIAIVADYLLQRPGGQTPQVVPTRENAIEVVTTHLLLQIFTCP